MAEEQTTTLKTDLGNVYVDWIDETLKEIRLGDSTRRGEREVSSTGVSVSVDRDEVVDLLERYFEGECVLFPTLDLEGFTTFQRAVWEAAQDVPFGRTASYGHIASNIGRPESARAVGAALGQNPFPPLIPCHRIVSSTGRLTGFAFGLAWKRALLDLEHPQQTLF